MTLPMAQRVDLKPDWVLLYKESHSRWKVILLFMTVSRVQRKWEISDMGLYDSTLCGFFLGFITVIIMAFPHLLGNCREIPLHTLLKRFKQVFGVGLF